MTEAAPAPGPPGATRRRDPRRRRRGCRIGRAAARLPALPARARHRRARAAPDGAAAGRRPRDRHPPPGLRALDVAGVGAEVRRRAVEIRDGRVTCDGRTLGAMRFAKSGIVRSLPQREVEALLERLAAASSVRLRRGVEVTRLRDRGTHVIVSGTEAGAPVAVAARYAVGADGVRSAIRSLIGADWHPRRGRASYVMCDTRDDTGARESALLHFEPAGVVESFPMPGGRRRWVAWVRRTPSELDAEAVATIVATRTGAHFPTDAAGAPTAFDAAQHLARPWPRAASRSSATPPTRSAPSAGRA